MITPPFLKKNDLIGIVCTARKISFEEVQPAINLLNSWGFRVRPGSSVGADYHQFGGSDELRALDFQQMMDDPEVKAILCARGGYGTVRIIDRLDFSALLSAPKWIIGYSDVTVLHAHLQNNLGIESLHGTMPIKFPDDTFDALQSLRAVLLGQRLEYSVAAHPLNQPGTANGILTGGNLSILYSLRGTAQDAVPDGAILFIEDLDEYLYHVDRMLINLAKGGWFDRLSGMIVGSMTEMKDNMILFGKTAEEIVKEYVSDRNFPVLFGFPAGHIPDNRTLILGRKIELEVNSQGGRVVF